MSVGISPPKPKELNSTTEAARIMATPESTALPPWWKISIPTPATRGWPAATAPRSPRASVRVPFAPNRAPDGEIVPSRRTPIRTHVVEIP